MFRVASQILSTLRKSIKEQTLKVKNAGYPAHKLSQQSWRGDRKLLHDSKGKTIYSLLSEPPARMMSDAAAPPPQPPKPKHTNRLVHAKSPYLQQHAHNPVDWYPWCEEAIERARQERKLIFLSVGYSTCHWCHVMEHESFEDEEVAAIMNEHYVNIKVDREERPDIDKVYMQFVLMFTGQGGWPMSVWLTPELSPVAAGTYFPPQASFGRPSFRTVLRAIARKWAEDRESLQGSGDSLVAALKSTMSMPCENFVPASAEALLNEAVIKYKESYDERFGGFGLRPKFPQIPRLNLLFHAFLVKKDADLLDMVLQTLSSIGRGGINDHVFGGFARYAVDRDWHVPHFEKMLYDQAQLMSAYAIAYKLTRDSKFLAYGEQIFRYIMKDLRHPGGGFYSGEDADSLPTHKSQRKVEGAFYAWTLQEVRDAIRAHTGSFVNPSRAADIYAYHYDLQTEGNVAPSSDPQGHLSGKNILIERRSEEETCAQFGISGNFLRQTVQMINDILYDIRCKRPRPHLDTKIITAWNGLMLSGLSELSECGSENRSQHLAAAKALVTFVRSELYNAERKRLLRSAYGLDVSSERLESIGNPIEGFLDDYAFLIRGLLDFYKASLDNDALNLAKELQDVQDDLFWDNEHGGYFYSQAGSSNVIVRLKEDSDGAEPAGNSIAAKNLILLSHHFDDESYRLRAGKLQKYYQESPSFGSALPEMMSAKLLLEHGVNSVTVVGPESPDTEQILDICRKFYIPGLVLVRFNPQQNSSSSASIQSKFKMVNDKTTVYICQGKVCHMPLTELSKLEQYLAENFLREEAS